jgi:hypothetical protein
VPGMDYHLDLAALSPTGQVRWRGHTIMDYANAALRFGPDGALSWAQAGEHVWTQLTTPAGRLLIIAEQRRQTRPGQPLAGGRRLLVTKISNHDWRPRPAFGPISIQGMSARHVADRQSPVPA